MTAQRLFFLLLTLTIASLSLAQNYGPLSKGEQDEIARLLEVAKIHYSENDMENAGISYSRVAFVYWKAGKPREAIQYFSQAGELLVESKKLDEAKKIYSNIGVIHTDLEELELAIQNFEKSLEIRRTLGDKTDISAGLVDVAYIMQILGYYEEANEYLMEALNLATEVKNSRLILDCYQLLSLNYEMTGNVKKSVEFAGKAESYQAFLTEESLKEDFATQNVEKEQEIAKSEEEKRLAALEYALNQERFKRSEDSLNFAISSKQDSLMQAGRLARAAQLEIDNLNSQREIDQLKQKELENQQQKARLIMLAGGALIFLMVLIAIVILRANQARKRANEKLEKQNKEIAEKSEQLGSAIKKIAHQNQNITQSINYARGIQKALLPKAETLNGFIKDSFILFQPRDIVSGDFYWFKQIDAKSDIFKIFGMNRKGLEPKQDKNDGAKKFAISAVDCTGHGVPGAFMSMIGYNLLDEITNKGITRPDLILEELHRGVRSTLKQKETSNQDGMDMAICIIDEDSKELTYAGAKNPLIYMQDGEVKQIKGDKYGIGGKSDDHHFTSHTIKLDKPTWVYLFSDGYIDQFGGDTGRKFMIKRFREKLHAIHKDPMAQQKEHLEQVLKDWKGTKYNQIDDILVIGFKLDFTKN